jgi:hypothetical protein
MYIFYIYLYIPSIIPRYTAEMKKIENPKKYYVAHIRRCATKSGATFCGASTDMRHRI